MENASKALVMAGSMLISIIVISIFVLSYSNITSMKQAQADNEQLKEVTEYNKKFEAFNKTRGMYGVDLVSVLNLAMDNNRIFMSNKDEEYYIDIVFTVVSDIKESDTSTIVFQNGTTYSLSKDESFIKSYIENLANQSNKASYKDSIKRAYFYCSGVEYDRFGKISSMNFKQVLKQ